MQHSLDKLNPQQREGVEAVDGPVLILAGAGSGKTRVITHRIAYLVEQRGAAPDSILAVTFTNKAAAEMGERVEKLMGHGSLAKPLISTFHSFCVRLLRRDIEALRINNEGLTKSFAIYDETDQQAVVKAVMRRMGLDDKQLTPRVALSKISWAKNHMIDPQEFYLQSADPTAEKVAKVATSPSAVIPTSPHCSTIPIAIRGLQSAANTEWARTKAGAAAHRSHRGSRPCTWRRR